MAAPAPLPERYVLAYWADQWVVLDLARSVTKRECVISFHWLYGRAVMVAAQLNGQVAS
jgi:hypothetical protein